MDGFMIAETEGLRSTALYLIYMTFWLQRKYQSGLPTNSISFAEFASKNYNQTIPPPIKRITECTVLPMEGFIDFVMSSEYRANMNQEFAQRWIDYRARSGHLQESPPKEIEQNSKGFCNRHSSS